MICWCEIRFTTRSNQSFFDNLIHGSLWRLACRGLRPAVLRLCARFPASVVPSVSRFYYRATVCVRSGNNAAFAVAQCPSVRLSRWCIVSTQLKISSNYFLDHVAPSFYFLTFGADTPFQWEPLQRGRKIHVVRKVCDFRIKSPFISQMVRDRPLVAMER